MVALVFTDVSIIMEQNVRINDHNKLIRFTNNSILITTSSIYAFTFNLFVLLKQIHLGRPDAIPRDA